MAFKIAAANIKGGIGKSTTALNLTDQLLKRGYKVLMIDCDPQRNTTAVYRAKTEDCATMYDIIFSGYSAEETIQSTEFGDIIPNDVELKNADSQVKPGPGMYKHLKKNLAALEDKYDFMIFDTPPHNGVLLGNVLMACDGVVIPVECDLFGIQGLRDFYSTLQEFKEDNEKLTILGILKVKYKKNQNLTKDLEESTLPKYAENMQTKVFQTAIRESVKCKEAITGCMRLSQYAPKSTVEQDYSDLTDEILKEVRK